MNDIYPLWLAELAKQDSAMYQAFALPLMALSIWALWRYLMPLTVPKELTRIVCNIVIAAILGSFWIAVMAIAMIGEKR